MKPVPARPARDARLRRHSMPTITRARQLAAGGWAPSEIQRLIEQEFGVKPAINSIKYWTDEKARKMELERRQRRKREVAEKKTVTPDPFTLSDDLLLALRIEDGLPYTAIAKVARRFYAVDLDPAQIRFRLNELGAPKNPNKARATSQRNRTCATRKAAA